MHKKHFDFLAKLPEACQDIAIEPGKKVILTHRYVDNDVYVVKLTDMPGKQDVALKVPRYKYISCPSTHESYDRWFMGHRAPDFYGEMNPEKPVPAKMLSLF